MPRETITRRNLPHWYVPGAVHFVTFRLAGTLPRDVIDRLQQHRQRLLNDRQRTLAASEHRERVHKQLFAAYDAYLDEHLEIDWLRDPRIGSLVRRSLYHLHGDKFLLLAYTIMPNHVHVLFQPTDSYRAPQAAVLPVGEYADEESPLSAIMHSLKGFTAHRANKLLSRRGQFWQHESYDHWIRDDDELERVVGYINANAVRANLALRSHDWYWSSAHDRYLIDGDTSGWLNLPVEQASPLASV
jgi:REP-associated tyrosine transposase